ncbi:hypothetical protein PI124_g21586 [Phytophthora idaei]|nr:hypothetical protein PI125_g23363 [Phytophthora idaei]KAG3128421.1 hypothetical protein PI126_g21409 [Phytophthora idaei]KAG3233338.1 hypothetical protein PI124_g21586 [Phytophthora idaei]
MMVHQVRAKSVLLLMTMLRDTRSSGATFRRVAGRLIMILLEEALAIIGTESVEVITGTGHLYRGLALRHQFCGVTIASCSSYYSTKWSQKLLKARSTSPPLE